MNKIQVTISVDNDLKNETEYMFKKYYGMTFEDGVNEFLRQCALEGKFPFIRLDLEDCDFNDTTLASFLAANTGHDLVSIENVEDILEELDEEGGTDEAIRKGFEKVKEEGL